VYRYICDRSNSSHLKRKVSRKSWRDEGTYRVLALAITKGRYGFSTFSYWSFKSNDFSNSIFCLIKLTLFSTYLACYQIGIRRGALCTYMESSLPESWNRTSQLYWNPVRSDHTDTLKSEDWRTRNIEIRRANLFTLEVSYWLVLWKPFTIGPMSADQHKQVGIRRGARSVKWAPVTVLLRKIET
jgi:hypothetical protein